MASLADKRPADSDKSAETFTVCTHCNRLSNNLTWCEGCGTALPQAQDSSSSVCYNPKRSRPDIAQPGNLTASASTDNSPNMDTNTPMTSQPVPQGLFVNSHSEPSSMNNGDVRPQALFMNLNNVAVRVTAPQATTAPPVGQIVSYVSNTNSAPARLLGAPHNTYMPPNVTAPITMTTQSLAHPVSNPAPPNSGLVTSEHPPPPYPIHRSNGVADVILLKVHQIRIGTRKFMPQGEVEVKDEGVLLTLANYNQAPVLLNARAINGAKMCLAEYPVIFLFLENSCIKQIKNIFKISSHQFSEGMTDSPMKRCITLFPSVSNSRLGEITNIFRSMEEKFYHGRRICTVIPTDQAIDMLLGSEGSTMPSNAPVQSTAQVANTTLTTAAIHGAGQLPTLTGPNTNLAASRNALNTAIVRQTVSGATASSSTLLGMITGTNHLGVSTGTHVVNSMPNIRPPMPYQLSQSSGAAGRLSALASSVPVPSTASATTGSNTLSFNTGANPPTLKIPHDPMKWQQLQRKLVVGGVYQVLTPDGAKKYCLWNGEKLMPCLVQNTEVQLSLQCIRIGSMLASPVNMVHIKGDIGGGISFKLQSENEIMEVKLKLTDIQNIAVCFEHIPCLFIHPTASGADAIRQQCKMFDPYKNPYYSLNSREVRHRHILLMLKEINSDQKEALVQMKRPGAATPTKMINSLHYVTALKIIASIKENTKVHIKITDFISRTQGIGGPVTNSTPTLESIAREIQESESPGAQVQAIDDDDDDDVIMTSEEVGIKCPYTQKVMQNPVRNRICGHNYEKSAIIEFITRKKGVAKCPYAGCGNKTALSITDLDDNQQLQEYILQNPVS